MYSVILMATMTAGAPEAPQFGLRARAACYGYGGACYGYAYGYACRGGCAGACWGCGGCWGMGGWGGRTLAVAPMRVGYPGAYYAAPVRVYGGDIWGTNYHYSGSTPFIQLTAPDEPKVKVDVDKSLGGSARLIIEVPANAKVTIDGQPMKSTSTVRRFYTPKLDEGQKYFYDVKVEGADGDALSETRRVYVRANEVVRESFAPSRGATVANK